MGIDTQIARSVGHQLAEPNGSNRAQRTRVIGALDLDVGAIEQRPIGDRQTRLAQSVMTAVTQGGGLDGVEDFWGGAGGGLSRDRCLDSGVRNARFCEEKKAPVCLLRRGNQLAVWADLEDETVGQGQGRGTNACTQSNDERSRAVSCL